MSRRLILIGGGSCSGKSTFSHMLVERLPVGSLAMLSVDDYYRDGSARTFEERRAFNYDEPSAIEHQLLVEHVRSLLDGNPVDAPRYDFSTHSRRADTVRMEPVSVLLVEGIFSLCYPHLLELASLGVFVTADTPTRRSRRLERDVERGRDLAFTERQLDETVLPMHDLHVEPSSAQADLLVPGVRPFDRPLDVLSARLTDSA